MGQGSIVEEAPGIYRVAVPIPTPLRQVNCYLARGREGWTVVDAGFHTAETEQAWHEVFQQLHIHPRDVQAIIVTHFHPDHYGAAGWLQEWTQAPVYMHRPEVELARRLDQDGTVAAWEVFARRHGLPDRWLKGFRERRRQLRAWVQPAPQVTAVDDGAFLPVGDRTFQVVWTPGHTDGLVVLWNATDGILLANDLVLGDISPNISAGVLTGPDPLGRYLESLDRVRQWPAQMVLPGHRQPLTDLRDRCDQLIQHHWRRLDQVLEVVRQRGPLTGWEVAVALFPQVLDSPAQAEFALGETVAHLEYWARRGRIRTVDGGDRELVRYASR